MLQISHYLIILELEAVDIFECLRSCINHKKVGRPINSQIQDKSIIIHIWKAANYQFSAVAGTNQVSALFNVYRGVPALQNALFFPFLFFSMFSDVLYIKFRLYVHAHLVRRNNADIQLCTTCIHNHSRLYITKFEKRISNNALYIGPNHNQSTESTIFCNIGLTILYIMCSMTWHCFDL